MTTNYIYNIEEVRNKVNNMNTKVNSEGLTLQTRVLEVTAKKI